MNLERLSLFVQFLVSAYIFHSSTALAESLPDGPCGSVCQQAKQERQYQENSAAISRFLTEYQETDEAQIYKESFATSLRYIGVGLASWDVSDKALVGPAIGIGVEVLNNTANALYDSSQGAVEKFVIATVAKGVDDLVDANGLLNEDAFSEFDRLLADPSVYEEIAEEDRATLRWALATTTSARLRKIATEQQGATQDLERLRREVRELQNVIQVIDDQGKLIVQAVVEGFDTAQREIRRNNAALVDLQGDVKDLQKIQASQLPAAQRLQLHQTGQVPLDSAALLRVEREAIADEIRYHTDGIVKVVSGFSAIIGNSNPELAAEIKRASGLVVAASDLVSAGLLGNGYSAASSVLSIASVLSARKNPDPSRILLKELFKVRQEMQEYHIKEMTALSQLNRNLYSVRDELLKAIRGVESGVDWLRYGEFVDNLTRFVDCKELSERYLISRANMRSGPLTHFATVLKQNDRFDDQYSRCIASIESRVKRELMPTEFTALETVRTDGSLSRERSRIDRIRDNFLRPVIRSIEDKGTWPEVSVKYQSPICYVGEEIDTGSSVLPATSRLSIAGGDQVLSPTVFLTYFGHFREVLSWTPYLRDRGPSEVGDILPVSLEQLEQCLRSDTEPCVSRTTTEPLLRLSIMREMVGWLALQEQLISGAPLVENSIRLFENGLLEQWSEATSKSKPDNETGVQALYKTLSPPVIKNADQMDASQRCDLAGSDEWKALCLMEVNPFLAENVVKALVRKRLGLEGPEDSLTAYTIAFEQDRSDRLTELLGNDLVIQKVVVPGHGEPPKDHWAIVFPPAAIELVYFDDAADRESVSKRAHMGVPLSCTNQRPRSLSSFNNRKAQVKSTIENLRDSRIGRCYLLPEPASIAANRLSARTPMCAVQRLINGIRETEQDLLEFQSLAE